MLSLPQYKPLIVLLFLLGFLSSLTAQKMVIQLNDNGKSPINVHKLHKEQFGNSETSKRKTSEVDLNMKIIPIQYNKKALSAKVFGYFPDWMYPAQLNNQHFDLLTHISVFDFAADSLGNLSNPNAWPWTSLINLAHTNGVKVIMCVTNFTAGQIHNIITNPVSKQNFFNQVKNKILDYSLDGVNIDFEGPSTSDRGLIMNSFMSELTLYLHDQIPGSEISFASPSINWGGWDLAGLAQACDYLFIMGYDFYGSWSSTTGPSSPLSGGTYNIQYVLNNQYAAAIAANPKKIILGVPYYGNQWVTRSAAPYAMAKSYAGALVFSYTQVSAPIYGVIWDAFSNTPWYNYNTDDTTYRQIWYDNDSSIMMKYQLAKSRNIGGIGIWALGYDGTRMELWNKISEYLALMDIDEKIIAEKPAQFKLDQNFPNPFGGSGESASTNISFTLAEYSATAIQIFDVLGQRVYNADLGLLSPGKHVHNFTAGSIVPGVYFYRVTITSSTTNSKENSHVKRMLYLK